ncbi:MAG TPA: peptide-methionine (S)-S-oxide reductase MsrA [Gemmatimonadaceae bacterium]
MAERQEVATLGGGCFWCLDAPFRELRGVTKVESGYAGGRRRAPTYEQVCTGTTGHAEVVQVTFDPDVLPYRELLELFFALHDPTTPNRQGADVGTQYRSVIFWHSPEQRETAERVVRELGAQGIWDAPIVTELSPFTEFFPAEEYHQDYLRRNPAQPYCRVVVAPKLAEFRRRFAERLRGDDARIAHSAGRE